MGSLNCLKEDTVGLPEKGLKNDIMNEMNSFDPFLKFTLEEMTNKKLNFLNTTINSKMVSCF